MLVAMIYIVVDALMNGTGIRDFYEGGYIEPSFLNLSSDLKLTLSKWLADYEQEHYNGYDDANVIDKLDKEGKRIALLIKKELGDAKVSYYSDARMTKDEICQIGSE